MKPLFLSATALAVALGIATFYVPYLKFYVFTPKAVEADIFFGQMAGKLVSTLAWTVVAVPVAVAVHRFILMGQITHGFFSLNPRYTKIFSLWAVGLQLIRTLLTAPYTSIMEMNKLIGSLILIAFSVLSLIVCIYSAMIFPAVATEASGEQWSLRIVKSWRQMNGHAWLFVRSVILAFLPLVLVYFVFWILFGGLHASLLAGDLSQSFRPGLSFAIGLVSIFSAMLGAAVLSWLYAWIGQSRVSNDVIS